MPGVSRSIERVNDIFGAVMLDPSMESLTAGGVVPAPAFRHGLERVRSAQLELPDLKTIVVTQDTRDIDDIDARILRTPRSVELRQRIFLGSGFRTVRSEVASLIIKVNGNAPETGDITDDPEDEEYLRDELGIVSTRIILSSENLKNDVPVAPASYYFNRQGQLTKGADYLMPRSFEEVFDFLGGLTVASIAMEDPRLN